MAKTFCPLPKGAPKDFVLHGIHYHVAVMPAMHFSKEEWNEMKAQAKKKGKKMARKRSNK